MKESGLKLLVLALAVAVATGCSSSATRDDGAQSSARVEQRSTTEDGSTGDTSGDGAQTHGLDSDRSLTLAALDDPDGPLATRVIYFDYDSAQIRADFGDIVAAHASLLAANPDLSVTLEGHADERGSREYNLALGERRALAVRRQLVLLGASAGQIRSVSYGEERPAVDGHDEQSYSLNRRVEMVY